VELGDGAEIDKRVAELRALLSDPNSNVKDSARRFDEQVMRPIRKLIGDKKNIFLSCDGALNLIPFSSLVDENNRYLVETYRITYLTSGRDLLRLQAKIASKQAPMIVADPTFDRQVANAKKRVDSQSRRSFDLADVMFASLPGTAGEASALKRILPGAEVLTKTRATEGAVKRVRGPKVLHVATHGFFLPDSTSDEQQENPLLRSGIVLAGANYRKGGNGEDGILTALEAAGLDLWGTKIVVLSACETGVGEVRNGEGVYGLRRALVLAGSESQVISLWKVNDLATKDLMVGYYKLLQSGVGRTEALRLVQLKMLQRRDDSRKANRRALGLAAASPSVKRDPGHPFYWAGFIQSGDWRPLTQRF
jgi:CHAT domain-containing protein